MNRPIGRNLGTIDDRSPRQETLQWLFAARRHMELGNHHLAQELLNACLEREPDNLIVADAWARNWRVYAGRPARRRWRGLLHRFRKARGTPTLGPILAHLFDAPRAAKPREQLAELLARDASAEVAWRIGDALVESGVPTPRLVRQAAHAAEECGQYSRALELWKILRRTEERKHGPPRDEVERELARLRRLVDAVEAPRASPHERMPSDLVRAEEAQDAWLERLAQQAARAREDAGPGAGDAAVQTARRLERHYLDAAMEIYRERSRRYPEDVHVWHRWIELLRRAGRWDAIRRELETSPRMAIDRRLLAYRAESRQRARDFAGALADYAAYREQLPESLSECEEAARVLRRGAVLAEAMEAWDAAESFWAHLAAGWPEEVDAKSRLDKVRSIRHKE